MKKLIIILLLLPAFIFSQNKKEEKRAIMSANTWLTKENDNIHTFPYRLRE